MLKPLILDFYRRGIGHKTAAKELGISPRIAFRVLRESGEYKPGSLRFSEHHLKCLTEASKRAARERESILTEADRIKRKERLQKNQVLGAMRARVRSCLSGKRAQPKSKGRPRAKKFASEKERYHGDPVFRMKNNLRKRINKFVSGANKSARTEQLLGCTYKDFITHMERQFVQGMTWKNHGIGRGKWNIDHIMPCSSFDLTRPDQQRICFHFSNLRPMWAIANIKKKAKIKPDTLNLPLVFSVSKNRDRRGRVSQG